MWSSKNKKPCPPLYITFEFDKNIELSFNTNSSSLFIRTLFADFYFTFPCCPMFRISVEDALRHPFLKDYSCPEEEPVAGFQIETDKEEDEAVTLDDWRGSFYTLIEIHLLSNTYDLKTATLYNQKVCRGTNGTGPTKYRFELLIDFVSI